ncbi:HesA/MoeB/ThiF family protein [Lutimonas saemankumensis]|uniref:HesA/MoeB/ThiF family protein n=1 Tax=Lutimonas saemankumensis TaxID=483016 RepID=UPI001CD345DC|nr:HesA/MoeB/ThiF family protein [Lutimonas saemankumensis]MCA0932832.1 HesA/MoeB/ThiF family protein [Lutimonas saemankumensis]
MEETKKKMYIRQTTLPELGLKGQKKLNSAKIAVIGCGGLGSAAAVYLAGSGIGHIHLIDYDQIDQSNLHRQVFYHLDQVGESKAKVLSEHISLLNPYVKTSIDNRALTKETIHSQLSDYQIIVDCTDSLSTKYLLNDYSVLNEKVLVYGSLYKHDGYVGVFNLETESGRSSNLRDAFPQMPKNPVPNCSEIGTLNPIAGIIGLMQANEVIKIVTGLGEPLINSILIYNTLDNSQYKMNLKRGFSKAKIDSFYESEPYFDPACQPQEKVLLIEGVELKSRLGSESLMILSVIENEEVKHPFEVDLRMSLKKFDPEKLQPFHDHDIVVVCHKGISSYLATKRIKKEFPEMNVLSLKGGIDRFM